jgi:aldehyde:ferredoxin oxidoreductase
MLGGYMGKILWVDLSSGEIKIETPEERLYHDYIGGYGLAARLLYDRMKPGVDPLGPENILGLVTGPLTGTPAVGGSRFMAVGKSPLTGGWGDANCGGHFGPHLKMAGFDGVFFTGISPKPVYLLIDNGHAELKEAGSLWGKDTYETEDILEGQYGPTAKVACIGPSGEKLSLISCIITYKGDAAARSGLGAVMGSKKLKAVVVRGDQKVPVADPEKASLLRQEQLEGLKTFIERFHITGTGGHADVSALSGDSPVKNWGGVGVRDLPDVSNLKGDKVIANIEKRAGCWHCPAACKAFLKPGQGEYRYPAFNHRPEYETMGALGANCANTNLASIEMASHLCNAYGMDTISAGATLAFAMECYENGLITRGDTDGIELNWGNHRALIAMLEKMVNRNGFGDVLADGVKKAAERIGKGSEKYAVHIGGQEPGMHDPRLVGHNHAGSPSSAMYWLNSTPGRHTQAFGGPAFLNHLNNSMGICMILNDFTPSPGPSLAKIAAAVTGWDRSLEELLKTGDRIGTMRHLFNLREGLNPLKHFIHGRIYGNPPLQAGPLAEVTSDLEAEAYWHLGFLDWDRVTTIPSRNKLLALGMTDIAEELWPSHAPGHRGPMRPPPK